MESNVFGVLSGMPRKQRGTEKRAEMADAAGWAASVDNMLLNNAAGDTHAAAAQLFWHIRVVIAAGMDHQRVVFHLR